MFNVFKKLKKELLERYQRLENQIQESNSFNVLKERYQSLTILKQKLLKFFLISFILIAVLYFPLYYLSSSTMAWFHLKEKHKLSQELLKTREKSSFSTMGNTSILLKNQIERIIQKYYSEDFTVTQESKTYPKSDFINQIIFTAKIPTLNIRQAVQLAEELESLSQVRLEELTFTKNEEYENYYGVNYQLSAFVIEKNVKRKRRAIKNKKPFKREDKPFESEESLLKRENKNKTKQPFLKRSQEVLEPLNVEPT